MQSRPRKRRHNKGEPDDLKGKPAWKKKPYRKQESDTDLGKYREQVEELVTKNEDIEDTWAEQHGISLEEEEGKKPQRCRRLRRKDARKLKKLRRVAFQQKHELPTAESMQIRQERRIQKKREEHQKQLEAIEKAKLKKAAKLEKIRQEKEKEKREELEKQQEEEDIAREDRMINQLEKDLFLKKRKSKNLPQSFINDGLDFILDAINPEKLKEMDEGLTADALGDLDDVEKGIEDNDSEEGSDEAMDDSDISEPELSEDDDDVSDGDDDVSDGDEEEGGRFSPADPASDISTKSILKKCKRKDQADSKAVKFAAEKKAKQRKKKKLSEVTNSDSDEHELDESDCSGNEEEDEEYKEDIYGRLQDGKGNIVKDAAKVSTGSYVPPARRQQLAGTEEEKKRLELERLKKTLKGHLNRLSEASMHSISSLIEELFRSHSRGEVCMLLSDIVMAMYTDTVRLPERLSMEIGMLLAILHANVGNEVGASLLEKLAKQFLKEFAALSGNVEVTGKVMDNLLLLVSNMYNFKVIHSLIIFDLMKRMVERFNEKDVELLLLLLKNVGFSLRKDDPISLKEIIVQIQTKAADLDTSTSENRSRVNFMLDTLLAIKNNNMRKIPNYDPAHLDHLRKQLRNFVTGQQAADSILRISLDDLTNAEKHGRWWLVGSAWSERATDNKDITAISGETVQTSEVSNISARVLKLAKAQHMNTDVRRNIFCIILGSEDYVDACERVLRLGLKQKQEREIIHVALHMGMNEVKYNPFYSHLLQKLCEYDRRFMMTTKFTIWDQFKELGNLDDRRIDNLHHILVHLITSKALCLSLFKVVEFGELDKARVRLMRLVLSGLLQQDDQMMREVFCRVSTAPKLSLLREGLKLFMQHFLLRSRGGVPIDPNLKHKVALAERTLSASDSHLLL